MIPFVHFCFHTLQTCRAASPLTRENNKSKESQWGSRRDTTFLNNEIILMSNFQYDDDDDNFKITGYNEHFINIK